MPEITRRTILQGMAALPIAAQLPHLRAAGTPETTVKWLEGTPTELTGSTWGTPWPKGQVARDQAFALAAADGTAVPVQTWPLAYWPDGSLKWSAFALPPAYAGSATYALKPGTPAAPATPVTVTRGKGYVDVDTGVLQIRVRTAAWLTEWERGGDPAAYRKLLATMRTIGAMPNGFVTGSGLYNLQTGEFGPAAKTVSVSDLSAMFGQVEINAELIDLLDVPEFTTAWLKYCKFFNATKAEQAAEFGTDFGTQILRQGHSRLTAYASVHLQDPALATRAWSEFYTGDGYGPSLPWKAVHVTGTLNPVDEATWISTNYTALYGLAAIQSLALIGDEITKPS
jgi:hypothetical protein